MKYAISQINPTTGDIAGNTERIKDAMDDARATNTDVIVFPETAITGYCVSDLVEDDSFIDANRAALADIAEYTEDIAAVVGFIDRQGEDRYNAAAVIQDREVKDVVYKQLLPNYRYFDDERYFTAGDTNEPVSITVDDEEVSLGVSICEDMWNDGYDANPVSELVDAGADVLININASPFAEGKRAARTGKVERHIEEHGVPFLYANTVGVADVGDNILPFDGGSLAYNADGDLIGYGGTFAETQFTVDTGEADSIELPEISREQGLYEALVMALRDYAEKTGFDHAIQPVSGGIDSALGLTITADAFGPDNVTAYNLPSAVNSQETQEYAEELADNLGVPYNVVPVQGIYDEIIDTFEEHNDAVREQTAKENVYARTRGLLMMLASNDDGGLVVSNGNETELALGYATLYGDMTGGISLLGDLSKTDVYDLARYVNERHGEETIPEAIIDATPSAELSPGQEDPFDYEVVAPLVSTFLEERAGPQEIMDRFDGEELGKEFPTSVYEDRDAFRDIVQDTYDRFQGAAFKRVQAPPVIAVSERAFGTDFREPIINDWDGGLDR